MRFKITAKRILLGIGLSTIFILVCLVNVSSHKWRPAMAAVGAIVGIGFSFATAFTARVPQDETDEAAAPVARTLFRNRMRIWIVMAVVFLVIMKVLDTFHVPWRQFLR